MRNALRLLALAFLWVAAPSPLAGQLATADFDGLAPRNIGPATMSGRLVDIAVVNSNPKVFYIASATGGVWKTTDNGVRFEPVFQNEAVHSVGDIVVHQKETDIVWVGTGERANRQSTGWGDGVYKSINGGETWTNMGLPESHHIGRIVMHPDDADIVYVAALGHLWGPNEERGLYKTTDGGENWELVLYADELTGVVDIAMDPNAPGVLYAATYQRQRRPWGFHGGGPGSAMWKSMDAGATWTKLTNAGLDNGLPTGDIGRIGISIFEADPRILYASVEQGKRFNAATAYEQRVAGLYRSEDHGETWTFQSDWNPRPMYASQPLVDPNDDQRVYMLNAYSYSDDAGKTFTVPRQHRTHGDDRFVWVNPHDSEHIMKADDGGLGISYDRGDHFLYITSLPLSQFYQVSVDLAHPYNVYGGLQDNGSWRGPNAVYRAEGILNEDWVRWGGGDGFWNVVDTTNNRILYSESQYLGLTRNDMATGESRSIRPNQPEGFIGARRNWTTWPDLGDPDQRLGNAMTPGNWEGPFIISPHDPNTLYAGLVELYKSTDRGDTWTGLGDLTTGTDRRTLAIMEQMPDSFVLSLDDGIPYWPTLTAVAESEFTPGILYAGTDDGNVQISTNDGQSWTLVTDRMEGAPEMMWVNRIHASKSVEGRVYAVANNYRNDDYNNYIWRSDDDGMSWMSITGDLPAERVVRAVKEDLRNPDVLWMGTEFGVWWSWNGGSNWVELKGGMPTMAVNDLVVHPRDNDLVLGTHGRGVWILDQVNALQEMTPAIAATPAHLFGIEDAEQIRYRNERAHTGNMIFEGENPPAGAIIDYWLSSTGTNVSITVHDAMGAEIAQVNGGSERGMNRSTWNLRHGAAGGGGRGGGGGGPWVVPGLYTVRFSAGAVTHAQTLRVKEDPRIDVDPLVRRQWTETLVRIGELATSAQELSREAGQVARRLDADNDPLQLAADLEAKVRDMARETQELSGRITRLRGSAGGWVGPLSADQASQMAFFTEMLATLSAEWSTTSERLPGQGGHDPRLL